MTKKPLSNTNPHLQNPEDYRDALITNVLSSTAIETGECVEAIKKSLTESRPGGKRPVLHLKEKTRDHFII